MHGNVQVYISFVQKLCVYTKLIWNLLNMRKVVDVVRQKSTQRTMETIAPKEKVEKAFQS